MARSRRSSRPDLVRLAPWALGAGGLALGFVALQLLGPRLHLPAAATVGLALLGLLAAALAWRWRRRTPPPAAVAPVAASRPRRDFDARLARGFQAQGYQIVPAGTGGPVDLVLRRDRGTFLVHCRQWQAARLGVEVLHELQAVVTTRGAAGGIVVCQGRFSREAQRFAAGSTLKLIDGPALAPLLAD